MESQQRKNDEEVHVATPRGLNRPPGQSAAAEFTGAAQEAQHNWGFYAVADQRFAAVLNPYDEENVQIYDLDEIFDYNMSEMDEMSQTMNLEAGAIGSISRDGEKFEAIPFIDSKKIALGGGGPPTRENSGGGVKVNKCVRG